jgi:vancomycin aglycone glucosyltransferase
VCAPPDEEFADRLAGLGMPMVPFGESVRAMVTRETPPSEVERHDCFAVGEVNQEALFGRLAAVVHHGGAGTTTTAARAGAPQVVVPEGADQVYRARRVVELGVGTAYDGRAAAVDSFSAALQATLAPETGAPASAVAGRIRSDGAMMAAKRLLDAIS